MSDPITPDEQVDETGQAEACCAPGCDCSAGGLSNKAKLAICLLIGVAAVVVILVSSARKPSATAADSFATPATASTMTTPVTPEPAASVPAKPTTAAVWGPSLSTLAALNEEAADKKAVFVFIPAKDGKQTGAVKEKVEAAVRKARARDSSITAYTLATDAKEYEEISQQTAVPCVLAMVKGAGAAPVSGEITEATLLEALVTASRPSSCGPSGCGPTGCN
jgi:hypothetical protein